MTKVKIIGAGSIGNHLSHAARNLGWHVDLCDIDPAALRRARESIYPGRYGSWDSAIRLFTTDDAPKGGYDYIFVGTPPDSHIELARRALAELPRAILIEKPVCPPDLSGATELVKEAQTAGVALFAGYDHVVGQGARAVAELAVSGGFGELQTIDVEFREHWRGIFAAHPWLDGPADSYLGYWQRGGGASGEHSHALNLWQHFALATGQGRVVEVSAVLDYVDDGTVCYDRLCLLQLRTESGLCGRVVQDVITDPARKWARLQGSGGYVEWHYAYRPGQEAVITGEGDGAPQERIFEKTRSDDFIQELRHLAEVTDSSALDRSPIAVERALDTMLVVAAAHRAARGRTTIQIDYDKGYAPDDLVGGRGD